MVTSIQDTVGSDIAFAAILHMAQSTPSKMLRCALDTRSMVTVTTAEFNAPIKNGGTQAPQEAGLGVHPNAEVLGEPVLSFVA